MENKQRSNFSSRLSSPGQLILNHVSNFIEHNNLSEELLKEVPKKWEKYGDFVLFDEKAFSNSIWEKQNASFWLKLCEILKCTRIGIKSKISDDSYRTPNVRMLVGDNTWVLCTDNAIKYTWNVKRNMFSAGNASERHRVARLNCQNEVVVDLYAGIGYFTLPFLVHAKAAFVHACEWNPDAVIALKRSLELNKIREKCAIYEGDNRLVCPKNVADRVNLGLIPSSEASWRTACEALKPDGGTLHVHGNVETKKSDVICSRCRNLLKNSVSCVDKTVAMRSDDTSISVISSEWKISWKHQQWFVWSVHVIHCMVSILQDINNCKIWRCSVENVHFVKSYAPHVHHLVLDVRVKELR